MSKSLFDKHPYANELPHSGTDTSIAAAKDAKGKSPNQRRMIHGLIMDYPHEGVTDCEGHRMAGMLLDTYRARRAELKELGIVVDSGKRKKTRNGKSAIAWTAIPVDEAFTFPKVPKLKKKEREEILVQLLRDAFHHCPSELQERITNIVKGMR